MEAVDILTSLKDFFSVLGGAFAAILGATVQSRQTNAQARSKLRLEKLERAYTLCQLVFDCHLREINNLKALRQSDPNEFRKLRRHPGAEMSELKMLVRCYVPELETALQELDNGHGPLKRLFLHQDASVMKLEVLSDDAFQRECAEAEAHLLVLERASLALKQKLAAETKRHT